MSPADPTPYRPLPVVQPEPPVAVCAWCKWSDDVRPLQCNCWRNGRTFSYVDGYAKPTAAPFCDSVNPDGKCIDYAPSWFTRYVAWWRKAP